MLSLLFLLPSLALAAPKPIAFVQKFGEGRQVRVEFSQPNAGKPTFLFLPGVIGRAHV